MTQKEMVLHHMKATGSITTFDAFKEFGITRLAARIHEIGKEYPIGKIKATATNRYGQKVSFDFYYIMGASSCPECGMFDVFDTECGYECQSCNATYSFQRAVRLTTARDYTLKKMKGKYTHISG
jgi:hypothetical protein